MDGEGFEPSKAELTDLQSAPFGHSGTHPYLIYKADLQLRADERTRTVNLLITNQLLCQLSHIGILNPATTDFPGQFPTKYFSSRLGLNRRVRYENGCFP